MRCNSCNKSACDSCGGCAHCRNFYWDNSKGWNLMSEREPQETDDILFLAKTGITEEVTGLAIPDDKIVLLRRTDISFDDILYWRPFPKPPKDYNGMEKH